MKTKKLILVGTVLCLSMVLFAGCKSSSSRTYKYADSPWNRYITLDKGDSDSKGTGKATKVWLPVGPMEYEYTGNFEYNNNKLTVKSNVSHISAGETFSRSEFKINYNASTITVCSRDYKLQ
ncbi:MAG: hypothetical protein J5786_04675 [Clostridiales bacterium]|nr:hypothetical protein [Clostridiales bacterium]